MMAKHRERHAYPLTCECGYAAVDDRDMDDHLLAMARATWKADR